MSARLILKRTADEYGWGRSEVIDFFTDFVDDLICEGKIDETDFEEYVQYKIMEREQQAREESEAGDLEMAGFFITCPVCGSAGHPDAVHKGECHAHLSSG